MLFSFRWADYNYECSTSMSVIGLRLCSPGLTLLSMCYAWEVDYFKYWEAMAGEIKGWAPVICDWLLGSLPPMAPEIDAGIKLERRDPSSPCIASLAIFFTNFLHCFSMFYISFFASRSLALRRFWSSENFPLFLYSSYSFDPALDLGSPLLLSSFGRLVLDSGWLTTNWD